jgi:hypothetical protein
MPTLRRLPMIALMCLSSASLLGARPAAPDFRGADASRCPVSVRATADGSVAFGLPGWELVLGGILELHPTPAGVLLRRRGLDGRDEFGIVAAKEGFRRLSVAQYRERRRA